MSWLSLCFLVWNTALADEEVVDAAPVAPLVDRAQPPVVTSPEMIAMPGMERVSLSSGATLLFVPQKGLRKATLRVELLKGHMDLDATPSEARGYHNSLMSRATKTYTSEELELLTDLHDIDLYGWHSHRETGVQVRVPNDDVQTGFDVLRSVLTEPSFAGRELKLRRQELLRYYETTGPVSPTSVASAALSFSWYDKESPYGVRPDLEAMKSVRRSTLKKRHAALLADAPARFFVTGDMTLEEAKALCEPLAQTLGGNGEAGELPLVVPPKKKRVVAIDMPDAKQAIIRLRMPAPRLEDAETAAVYLANWSLGGHFMSRLNRNIREEKGLTYGVYSRFASTKTMGALTVQLDVAKENASVAVQEIFKELNGLATNGMTAKELEDAQVAELTDWNTTLQSSSSSASFYLDLQDNEWTVAQATERMEAAQRLTLDEVNQSVKKWFLPEDQWVLVLVGPKADLADQFPSESYALEWVSAEDVILGSI
jgi:zinc protease